MHQQHIRDSSNYMDSETRLKNITQTTRSNGTSWLEQLWIVATKPT